MTVVWQDYRLERWVLFNVEGARPPLLLLPALPVGWRWLWEGEEIPPGAEWLDWRDGSFHPVVHAIGATMNRDPIHISLQHVPVRIPSR